MTRLHVWLREKVPCRVGWGLQGLAYWMYVDGRRDGGWAFQRCFRLGIRVYDWGDRHHEARLR